MLGLHYYPYTLSLKNPYLFSAFSQREGFLLQVEFQGLPLGYGNYHPWPELGDSSCKEALRVLSCFPKAKELRPIPPPLLKQSLFLAYRDALWRKENISPYGLWPSLFNHYLMIDPQGAVERALKSLQLKEKGFEYLKIKISPQVKLSPGFLSFCEDFRLRLDGNACFGSETFLNYFQTWSPQLIQKIEYVEDPLPLQKGLQEGLGGVRERLQRGLQERLREGLQEWRELQEKTSIPFALDRGPLEMSHPFILKSMGKEYSPNLQGGAFRESSQGPLQWPFQQLIIKPAQQNTLESLQAASLYQIPCTFSGYMDHPIGQVHAALAANEGARLFPEISSPVAGLLSHLIYEPDPFSELLDVEETRLQVEQDGPGIGFTSLLKKLPWKTL